MKSYTEHLYGVIPRRQYVFIDINAGNTHWYGDAAKEITDGARWYTNYRCGEVNIYFMKYDKINDSYLLTTLESILAEKERESHVL